VRGVDGPIGRGVRCACTAFGIQASSMAWQWHPSSGALGLLVVVAYGSEPSSRAIAEKNISRLTTLVFGASR
jgi:hypothetical protein